MTADARGFRKTVADLLVRNEKIQAVKTIKTFYGIGLKEAKDLMDRVGVNGSLNLICADVDRVFDYHESLPDPYGGTCRTSEPISRGSKRSSGDVEKLAETLADLVWAKLEVKIEQTIAESVGWDIQQVRNDLSDVIRQLQDTDVKVSEVRKDIAATQHQLMVMKGF